MKKIWVLVADEAITRILHWPEEGNELESVEELTDSAAHADGMDLRRDAAGRRSGSATHNPHTPHRLRNTATVTASAGEDEQHREAEEFARRVANHLTEALQGARFDELQIAAAPRFLGLLRKHLEPAVAARVTQELNKDLIHMDNREITSRLFPDGRPPRRIPVG
jgi:protein required for attachment to host cells